MGTVRVVIVYRLQLYIFVGTQKDASKTTT